MTCTDIDSKRDTRQTPHSGLYPDSNFWVCNLQFYRGVSGLRQSRAPHIMNDCTPLSIFMLFLFEIMQLLVKETNRYYQQYLDVLGEEQDYTGNTLTFFLMLCKWGPIRGTHWKISGPHTHTKKNKIFNKNIPSLMRSIPISVLLFWTFLKQFGDTFESRRINSSWRRTVMSSVFIMHCWYLYIFVLTLDTYNWPVFNWYGYQVMRVLYWGTGLHATILIM